MKKINNYKIARELKSIGKSYRETGKILGVSSQRAQQYLAPTKQERDLLINKNNSRCSVCGKKKKDLAIHHLDYKKNIMVVLCVSCHSSIRKHFRFPAIKRESYYSKNTTPVRVNKNTREWIVNYTKNQNITISEVIREAMEMYIVKHNLKVKHAQVLNGADTTR
jgi:hypothetical protein